MEVNLQCCWYAGCMWVSTTCTLASCTRLPILSMKQSPLCAFAASCRPLQQHPLSGQSHQPDCSCALHHPQGQHRGPAEGVPRCKSKTHFPSSSWKSRDLTRSVNKDVEPRFCSGRNPVMKQNFQEARLKSAEHKNLVSSTFFQEIT